MKAIINYQRALRGPYEIAVDVTSKCNYRCLHCYNSSGNNPFIENELTDEELLKLTSDIAGLNPNSFCICGGEPLIRIELLYKMADMLHDSGINDISIVTNGYYLTEDIAKNLINHHINRIQISLDGSDAATCFKLRQNENAFERAINALKIARNAHFLETNIAFCPTKFNIDQFMNVYKICCDLKVNMMRVQPLMVIGRSRNNVDKILPSQSDYVRLCKILFSVERNPEYLENTQISWGDPIDHLFRFREEKNMLATFISLKSNGNIEVSPYLPITVGNIRRHSLQEYWKAGLGCVWLLDVVKKLSNNIYSVADMGKQIDGVPLTWIEDDIDYDIIENQCFLKLGI